MSKKILLVDDDADDRAMFCEALQEVSPRLQCDTAANGRAALAKLGSGDTPLPDLIFLDLNMPVMNGWKCMAALKETEAYRHIPVIMYSTSSHSEDIEQAQAAGALCFFVKPSSFSRLRESLELLVLHLVDDTLDMLVKKSPWYMSGTMK